MLKYLLSGVNRYFSKIFLFSILASMAVLSFIVVLAEVAEYNRHGLGASKIKFNQVIELSLLKLPNFIQFQLPFVILIAAVITFWRLNRSSEIIVSRSFGVSLWQITSGLSLVVLVVGLLNLVFINPVSAIFNQKQRELENRINNSSQISLKLAENGLWIREVVPGRQSIIHVQKIDVTKRQFQGVTIQNVNDRDEFISRIDADSAQIVDGHWHLQSVAIYKPRSERVLLQDLNAPTELTFNHIITSKQTPQMLSFWRLPGYIQLLEKSGLNSLPFTMYWHSMISKIGLMIAMVFLSAAFCTRPIRQGYATLMVVFAIGSGLAVYFFNGIIYALGLSERLPILLANWALVLVICLLSATLILHQEEG